MIEELPYIQDKEPVLARSCDPRVLKTTDAFIDACNADKDSLELVNKILVRLDRGQLSHKNDYLVRDCIEEALEEILDTIGWPIMHVVKHPEYREQTVQFMIQVKELYRQFKDFQLLMKKQTLPKIEVDRQEAIKEYIINDVPEK